MYTAHRTQKFESLTSRGIITIRYSFSDLGRREREKLAEQVYSPIVQASRWPGIAVCNGFETRFSSSQTQHVMNRFEQMLILVIKFSKILTLRCVLDSG